VVAAAGCSGFDKAAGTLVTLADAADHPARLHAHLPGAAAAPHRALQRRAAGRVATGAHRRGLDHRRASGDPVQMWLSYPPGFDPKKKHPLLQVIHGGPHTAFGDNWHYRWNTQVFAAQGYVVACVNYHGSTELRLCLPRQHHGRWGELELQDVEAATDWLLQQAPGPTAKRSSPPAAATAATWWRG
jgi:dipeptidyl aminopeptidase/acylaminoacyl peptidase